MDISFAILLLLCPLRFIVKNLPKCRAFVDIHDIPTATAGVLPPDHPSEGVLICLVQLASAFWAALAGCDFGHKEVQPRSVVRLRDKLIDFSVDTFHRSPTDQPPSTVPVISCPDQDVTPVPVMGPFRVTVESPLQADNRHLLPSPITLRGYAVSTGAPRIVLPHFFDGTRVLPEGPLPMICTMTSPSFAQLKWGSLAGSVYTLPAGSAVILLSSMVFP